MYIYIARKHNATKLYRTLADSANRSQCGSAELMADKADPSSMAEAGDLLKEEGMPNALTDSDSSMNQLTTSLKQCSMMEIHHLPAGSQLKN